MNRLERSAIRRAEKALAGAMETGEHVLEFDIGRYPDGKRVHVIASDRAVYFASAAQSSPLKVPFAQIAWVGGGLTHLELVTLDQQRIRYEFTRGRRPIYQRIEAQLALLPRSTFRQQVDGSEIALTYRPCLRGPAPASWAFEAMDPDFKRSHSQELATFQADAQALLAGETSQARITVEHGQGPGGRESQVVSALMSTSWMLTFADHFCAWSGLGTPRVVAETRILDLTGFGLKRVLIGTDEHLLVVDNHHLFERDWVQFPWDRTMLVELREPEDAGQMLRLTVFDEEGVRAAKYDDAMESGHGWLLLLGFDNPQRDDKALGFVLDRVRENQIFEYPEVDTEG